MSKGFREVMMENLWSEFGKKMDEVVQLLTISTKKMGEAVKETGEMVDSLKKLMENVEELKDYLVERSKNN